MSKLDVGVGEDFPLDAAPDRMPRHGDHHRHHHHGHHHHHHHRHHDHPHGWRRRHGLGGLPLVVLVGAGLLVWAGKIPVAALYGALGLVVVAMIARAVAYRRWHRVAS